VLDERRGDVTPDEARSTGDQHAFATKRCRRDEDHSRTILAAPSTPRNTNASPGGGGRIAVLECRAMSVDKRPLCALALLALVLGAIGVRVHPAVVNFDATSVDFLDADTVRRLVKVDNLAAATDYPFREPRDGFPEGAVIQWSLPMDWVIQALDATAPAMHPATRRYETGAMLAGPVLGALAVLAFALLAWRLLPPGQAALAALLYAVSAPGVEVTRFRRRHRRWMRRCRTATRPHRTSDGERRQRPVSPRRARWPSAARVAHRSRSARNNPPRRVSPRSLPPARG
jgi:hypothetical protein